MRCIAHYVGLEQFHNKQAPEKTMHMVFLRENHANLFTFCKYLL